MKFKAVMLLKILTSEINILGCVISNARGSI